MRKKCARCLKPFNPDEDFHILCDEDVSGCFKEVDYFGSGGIWRSFSALVNGKWTREELKDLADSAAFDWFVTEVMREKDIDTRLNWLKKQLKELTK